MQKYKLLGLWEGYRSSLDKEINPTNKPGFQVKRSFRGKSACKVIVELDKDQTQQYRIESWSNEKLSCKILDKFGRLVAEVIKFFSTVLIRTSFTDHARMVTDDFHAHNGWCLTKQVTRKQSTCGVVLGEDVLTLVVEPFMDHSLIVGLLVVYGLINCRL